MRKTLPMLIILLGACISYAHAGFGFTKYNVYDPFTIVADVTTCDKEPQRSQPVIDELKSRMKEATMGNLLITSKPALTAYAEDFGHIVHTAPLVAFVPRNSADIAKFITEVISIRKEKGWNLQVVVRGGGGSVQGAAQGSCANPNQIVIDMSLLNATKLVKKEAWVQAGATWVSFVKITADAGLRPKVIPAFLSLTIGGVVSAGGFGADSLRFGPIANQVLEFEVVTTAGKIVHLTPDNLLFKSVRGGLGQFAIITAVRFPLIELRPLTTVIKILTPNFDAHTRTLETIVNLSPQRVNGVSSYTISNSAKSLLSVATKDELETVKSTIDRVVLPEHKMLFVIQIVVRTQAHTESLIPDKSEVASWLDPELNQDLIFYSKFNTTSWDDSLNLYVKPLLVKSGAWNFKKPQMTLAVPAKSMHVVRDYIRSIDQFQDLGLVGQIYMTPFLSSKFKNDSLLAVPRSSPIFYYVVLSRVEETGLDSYLQRQIDGNRRLWDLLKAEGEVSIYGTCYLPVQADDWAHSFGQVKWKAFNTQKGVSDPDILIGDQRNFNFSSAITQELLI